MSEGLKKTPYSCQLMVFFEEPFWVGVFESRQNDELSVCKVTFGSEPKDQEIFEFIMNHFSKLNFSPAIPADQETRSKMNPKRVQRQVRKQQENMGIGTKSQQALKLQQEQIKTNRKQNSRKRREEEQDRLFKLKQQKKKEKHRGR